MPVPVQIKWLKISEYSRVIVVKTQDTLRVLQNEWVSQVSHIPSENAQVTEKGEKA